MNDTSSAVSWAFSLRGTNKNKDKDNTPQNKNSLKNNSKFGNNVFKLNLNNQSSNNDMTGLSELNER